MTSLNVNRFALQSENRAWLRGPHGTEPGANANITLDIPAFAGLYPNGFIPSGILVGKITASGKYGPYFAAGTDGTETAAGHLFGSLSIEAGATVVGGALVSHAFVNAAKLPVQTGKGALDAAARADLTHIIFE